MNEKDMFLQSWEREFNTTMKVLKAYPENRQNFKPHEISKSAKELAWNFVVEEKLIDEAIQGEIKFSNFGEMPDSYEKVLEAYQNSHLKMVEKVKNHPDDDFNTMIKFPIGPKQMGDFRKIDVFWAMMQDMIHHRGQFSVYLRMAGGKVPSIYGPSHDEPWM